jgi:NADPH2:quinone reductase
MSSFKAFRVFQSDNKIEGSVVDLEQEVLGDGDVVFKVAYSSVNYKDALAATGRAGKVMRRYPLVGGIDSAGVVEQSSHPAFKPGDSVICTSYDMGVSHDGGFSHYCRVPSQWLVPLPKGLSLLEAMSLGTAGYTAALAIELLEQNGLKPEGGPIVINGATGGVGSILVDILSGLDYEVTALTGKRQSEAYLQHLGAKTILPREAAAVSARPLEKSQWAAAFDSVGSDQLTWLTKTMKQNGLIACFGNAGGIEFTGNVLPFILRGLRLIGVDSVLTPISIRQHIWNRLATDLKPRHLPSIVTTTLSLDQLKPYFELMLDGQVTGRAVVDLSKASR